QRSVSSNSRKWPIPDVSHLTFTMLLGSLHIYQEINSSHVHKFLTQRAISNVNKRVNFKCEQPFPNLKFSSQDKHSFSAILGKLSTFETLFYVRKATSRKLNFWSTSHLEAARESAGSLFSMLVGAGRGFVPRAGFEVAGYLWLDVLEVDINVGYCKHLTVCISIRCQLRLQPLESEEG
ncbi:hypothetical protein K0M31_016627, partial [Melipona bicolor]